MPSREEYYDPAMLSMSNLHWLPWLQAQLLKRDIYAVTPEMPDSYKPDWNVWKHEIERFDIGADTMLVGHSCGGGFWVRYLSENPGIRVGKVVLVAPWLDPDKDETQGFFDFTIDPHIMQRTAGMMIYNSDNDMGNVHKSVATLRQDIPDIDYREFHKYGHFTEADMGTNEFPELLQELIG